MGSWAQAKLNCGQEGNLARLGAWNQAGGTGINWEGSGHNLGAQEPSHLCWQLGGRKECPKKEDFPLVSTVEREGMRSQSLGVSKQELAQESSVVLEDLKDYGLSSNVWVLGLEYTDPGAPYVTLT